MTMTMTISPDVRARLILAAAKEAISTLKCDDHAHDLLAQIIAQAGAMIDTNDRPEETATPLGANVLPFRRVS